MSRAWGALQSGWPAGSGSDANTSRAAPRIRPCRSASSSAASSISAPRDTLTIAALLFMRRMSEIAGARVMMAGEDAASAEELPSGVALYEINGPLFFGAAKNAMAAIAPGTPNPGCCISI